MEKNNRNNNIIINYKKRFIIRKDNNLDDLLLVKEFFEDPNKYLKNNKNIVVGDLSLNKTVKKSISLEDLHNNIYSNISNINSHLKRNLSVYKKKSKIAPLYLLNRKSLNSNLNQYLNNIRNHSENNMHAIGVHYQRQSIKDVINILKTSKDREVKNKVKSTNDLFPKKVNKEIRKNFYGQEKLLRKKLIFKEQSDLMSKLLANKVKRKEEDLLFNKIEDYRLKKQIIEYIDNSKSVRDKFGDNYWIANLRRPKNQKEIRFNYFKNNKKNNYPDKIIDYADKDVEFINNPNRLKKNKYSKLLKNLSIKNFLLSNKKLKFPDIEKMNEIDVVKGKSIVDQEYFGIIENKSYLNTDDKIFKLYKDPSEEKYNNIKDIVCGENYENSFRDKKNISYRINTGKVKYDINKINNNIEKESKKNVINGSHSRIEDDKIKYNKINNIKKSINIFSKKNRPPSIRIMSSN